MASFEFDGRQVKVLAQHEMELRDLAFIKEHFDIDGLVALEAGMGAMEPGAWRAILIASIRRTHPDISPTHGGIDEVEILPLVEELNRERMERLAADEEESEAQKEGGARPTREPRATRARAGSPS